MAKISQVHENLSSEILSNGKTLQTAGKAPDSNPFSQEIIS